MDDADAGSRPRGSHCLVALSPRGDITTECDGAIVRRDTDSPRIVQGFVIRDRRGNDVFGTNTYHLDHPLPDIEKGRECVVRFAFPAWLGAGTYSISVAAVESDTVLIEKFDWIDNLIVFQVTNHHAPFAIGSGWLPVTVTSAAGAHSSLEAP